MKYQKINSPFMRDEKTWKLIPWDWCLPEFKTLAKMPWTAREKIDGTNVRVYWDGKETVSFAGHKDNSQLPKPLERYLEATFTPDLLRGQFGDDSCILFGEGFGTGIQKPGKLYNPDGVSFALFDVRIGQWWLRPENVSDVATKMGIHEAPRMDDVSLYSAMHRMAGGFDSRISKEAMKAEGLVLTAPHGMLNRGGQRIICKVKYKDFSTLDGFC